MKVLLCIREDYFRNFAGDSMQVLKTQEFLRKRGVKADINNGSISDYSSYDIVHLFNLTPMGETYKYFKLALHYRKNIVVSPIYWDLTQYYKYTKDFEGMKLWDSCTPYRSEILRRCKMIYPNSIMEQQLIKNQFGEKLPSTVIYNGVEVEDEEVPLYNFKERFNLNNYILCVGRICERKNQFTLSKICNELGHTLVLIGNIGDRSYLDECLKFSNVKYIGFMDSYNIYNAYRFARLHVLPSFIETPGLSSLEAGASGCNIVTTEEGCAREYFLNYAEYCNPYKEDSIGEAILKAYKKPKSSELKEHIENNYSWNKCLEKLYESYERILYG